MDDEYYELTDGVERLKRQREYENQRIFEAALGLPSHNELAPRKTVRFEVWERIHSPSKFKATEKYRRSKRPFAVGDRSYCDKAMAAAVDGGKTCFMLPCPV